MAHILIVDDEQRMLELLELYLMPYEYRVTKASGGAQALEKLKNEPFDLIVLDIMMKDVDGFETCRRLRTFTEIPVLMLTAKDQKEDMIKGLKIGADDYVTKPFDEDVFIARIEALLRRSAPSSLEVNGLTWNEDKYELIYDDNSIPLTPKEFHLVGLLLKRPGHVYDRNDLLDLIWGFEADTDGRTIDSHVRNIREKVRRSGFPVDKHLKTVWGVGYKWVK